jgi:hypothetical protein
MLPKAPQSFQEAKAAPKARSGKFWQLLGAVGSFLETFEMTRMMMTMYMNMYM